MHGIVLLAKPFLDAERWVYQQHAAPRETHARIIGAHRLCAA